MNNLVPGQSCTRTKETKTTNNIGIDGVFFRDRLDGSVKMSLGYCFLCRWLDEGSPGDSWNVLLTPLQGNRKTKYILGYLAAGTGVLLVTGLRYYWVETRRVTANTEIH